MTFKFTPWCGCSGTYEMECSLVWEGIVWESGTSENGVASGFDTRMTNLRKSLDNDEGFHKGIKIINGNEVVPVTTENASVPYANLLIWFDTYKNGSFIQRLFYEDSSVSVGRWLVNNISGYYGRTNSGYSSHQLSWHTTDGGYYTGGLIYHPEVPELDYIRIFVSQFNIAKYPLNFQYDGTASGYRNAPHIFLPQVSDPKEYYVTCNYTHLANCGEGTHIIYKTGTASNPYTIAGSVYNFWEGHRQVMHWGTSIDYVGFYGLTTTSATFTASTPTVDELAERVSRCQHLDGICEEFPARWNHDESSGTGRHHHWLIPEQGHFVCDPFYLRHMDRSASYKGHKDAQNRMYWIKAAGGIEKSYAASFAVPLRYYPGSIDDETLLYQDDVDDKIRGRVYVYGRSQLCSPFSTIFHGYSSIMFPLGRYEIIQPEGAPPTLDRHGFTYKLYQLKLKKRVYDFTHQDFSKIKLNMFGSEDYYQAILSQAPFIHTKFTNGFSLAAYPETHLFTDPNNALPDFTKTQGYIIGAPLSHLIVNWSGASKNFGIIQKEEQSGTITPQSVSDGFWLMDTEIPEGGYINNYDQGYYSSFDLTNFNKWGNVMYVPSFRDFTTADNKKVKIPDIPDDVYDTILPGDGYLATNPTLSGSLYVYPMVYLSGYSIENNE